MRQSYFAALALAASMGVIVVDNGEAVQIGPDRMPDPEPEFVRERVRHAPSSEAIRLKRLAKKVNKK